MFDCPTIPLAAQPVADDAAVGEAERLGRFLLGSGDPPPGVDLAALRLGAFAYTAPTVGDRLRIGHREDLLSGLARSQRVGATLAPLVAAWREAGVDVLFVKGVHLAELVYPIPAMRFYGDVDAIIAPRELDRAVAVAGALGWAARGAALGAGDGCILAHPDGVHLDVQRYVLHAPFRWARRQRRFTEAVRSASVERPWLGTRLRVPDPVDAALICLLVHRAWGADRWGCKAHDLLDLRFLAEREGVTRRALDLRARELGCRRTLAAMLERCDPWSGRITVGRPRWVESWRLDARTVVEHTPFGIAQWMVRALHAPDLVMQLARTLPSVLRVRRALRRKADLPTLLASLTPPNARAAPPTCRERTGLVRGIRWHVRLVSARGAGACVVRSLALYHALRRRGLPVEFVSGVRRTPDGVVGHAWVEMDGHVLPELDEPSNAHLFRGNFRYPGPITKTPA